jgi:type IV pilus assembly protein PilP
MSTAFRSAVVVFIGLGVVGLAACSEEAVTHGTAPPPVARAAQTADAGGGGPAPKMEFTENDFIENDRDRDPFRSYASLFIEKSQHKIPNQLNVILPQYSLDELKLVAIVTGGEYPRAMLLDPRGKGWVVKRGDYVGKPDTVHTGGPNGTDYQLNWRVDRVRDGDVVLNREDRASNGLAPSATRIIPLHPETENKSEDDEQRL